MALGYNYVPSEELLDKEEEEEAAMESEEDNACLELQDEELDDKKETLQSQRSKDGRRSSVRSWMNGVLPRVIGIRR